MSDYDLAVIGGGSGGIRAATVAARLGARVLLAEASRIGGTCVIRGCVPKKLLVLASRYASESRDPGRFGWGPGAADDFRWEALSAAVAGEVDRLEKIYADNLRNVGVEVFPGVARIGSGRGELLLDHGGRAVTAGRVLIAVGARPHVDRSMAGAELCSVSDDVFEWARCPRRLLIVGAGYIALELGSLFLRLGAEVTLLSRGTQILSGFDVDVRQGIAEALARHGMRFLLQRRLMKVERNSEALVALTGDGESLPADAVLIATGRTPATAGLGLEEHGVNRSGDGAIIVDAQYRSSVPWIFAVGDAAGRHRQSTPHAIRDGQRFAEFEFGRGGAGDYPAVQPYALFTTPEAAGAGMTEDEAIESGRPVDVHVRNFRPLREALLAEPDRCILKTLVERSTDRILGVHIVGGDAAEMAQIFGLAIAAGVRRNHLDQTLPLHPTIAEEMLHLGSPVRSLG
jgi:glutathione reductase (NADPH)